MNRRANVPPPPTMLELVGVTGAVLITMAVALSAADFDLELSLVDEPRPRPAAHRPLPDLCTAFPASASAGSEMVPEPGTRTLDRNTARCTFQPTGTGDPRSLIVSAHRPEPFFFRDELADARDDFRRASGLTSTGTFTPLPGLGDEAKVATESDESTREAEVVARDGLLIVEVTYRIDYSPGTDVATVRGAAQRAAGELLKILPAEDR